MIAELRAGGELRFAARTHDHSHSHRLTRAGHDHGLSAGHDGVFYHLKHLARELFLLERTHAGGNRQRPCHKQTDGACSDLIRPLTFTDADIQLVAICTAIASRIPVSVFQPSFGWLACIT